MNIETALQNAEPEFFEKYRLMKRRLLNVEYEHWAAGFAEGNNHGRGHITRISEHFGSLLGSDPLKHLNAYELFLAMMSILYHDIGMLRGRSQHADTSKELLEGDTHDAYIINKIDKEIIKAAVVSHSSSKDIAQECSRFGNPERIGSYDARPMVIAALVRLADELDEDHRRADDILQQRLDLPEESRFFWLFCQRVWGVRPNLVSKRIDFSLALEPEDTTTYGKVPGGKIRHFVAFTAEKLAKINKERVTVNQFLPTELQYMGLHVDVKPLRGHSHWDSPRTFVFNDRTTADMFIGGFPELLKEPMDKAMKEILEQMRLDHLDEADAGLDRLASVADDLPIDLQMQIWYEKACTCSLKAKNFSDDSIERNLLLDQSANNLISWFNLGQNRGWYGMRTPGAEIGRMANDGDLYLVNKERKKLLKSNIPSNYWPKSGQGGGYSGGCVIKGTMIKTSEGERPVETFRPGDTVTSIKLTEKVTFANATVTSVVTSRTARCIRLNNTLSVTPNQPIWSQAGWVKAEDLKPNDLVMNHEGVFVEVTETESIDDYFEIFQLNIEAPNHNYLANGLLCHNKIQPPLPPAI